MQYRLRTLLIVLALGPPLLAVIWLARVMITSDEISQVGLSAPSVVLILLGTLAFASWFTGRIVVWTVDAAVDWKRKSRE